jgi:hypothetical protein
MLRKLKSSDAEWSQAKLSEVNFPQKKFLFEEKKFDIGKVVS